jgi:Ca-activated chloride channel family protein
LALSLSLGLAVVPAAAQDEAAEEPTFKVDVNLVNLLVTVKDAQGAPIGDLERKDFKIVDGGAPREIAVFERRTNRALSVALMVDASLSTAIELKYEVESAKRFLAKLLGPGANPKDRVAVLKFSDYVDMLVNFTGSTERLGRALERIRPEGGTSIYDAIVLSSEQLERRSGRRVMVIITDGGDTTSSVGFHDALEAAHNEDVVVYGILVTPIKSDAGRNTGGENALKTMTANTGGITFANLGVADLDGAFDEILRSLRTQYLLGYYPPAHTSSTEKFRPVSVTVDRLNARVLARNGYYVTPAPKTPAVDRISIQPKNSVSGKTP